MTGELTKPIEGELSFANLMMVVVDSLRLDVAHPTAAPYLSSVAALEPCNTTANFTWPSHLSMFAGFLPVPDSGGHLLNGSRFDRLLRSRGARSRPNARVGMHIDGTQLDAMRLSGRAVRGSGGVQFFDPASPLSLATLFPSFEFIGRRATEPLDNEEALTQLSSTPPLHGAGSTSGPHPEPWFMFVNTAATHFPYACMGNALGTADLEYVEEAAHHMHLKKWPARTRRDLREWGRGRQAASLRCVDHDLGALLSRLRQANSRPILLVVLSDHGEAFGEGGVVGHGVNTPEVLRVPVWSALL